MPRCCAGGCDCNIQAGAGISVTGTGSVDDPFVVAQTALADPASFEGVSVETTAPAPGSADSPPATPEGYLVVTINGDTRHIPFY